MRHIKKIKDKLAELEIKHKKPWVASVEEQIVMAEAEPSIVEQPKEDAEKRGLWYELQIDREAVLVLS